MPSSFTIIIPTYNRSSFIKRTIQSVLEQTYPYFEIIVVDDGSTDNTEEIVHSIADTRIKYYKKKNEERSIARNYGINISTGQYITFLDSDDILYPNHFEEAVKLCTHHKNPEWFHLAYEIKDEKGHCQRKENRRNGDINQSLITGNHLSCIGVFIRKDIIEQNLFNENPHIIGSEDYELWLRLASKYQLNYSNTITSCMIQHENRSVISSFSKEKLIFRISELIDIAKTSQYFEKRGQNKFIAHRFLYLSLHLLISNFKREAFSFFIKAVFRYPPILINYKSLVIIKKLII